MKNIAAKISQKKTNAAKEGLRFFLTPAEINDLLQEAGITAEQWNHGEYHLARFGDTGDYVSGNCRFIPASDNYAERKVSDKSREESRKIAALYFKKTDVERKRISSLGGKASGGQNKLTDSKLKSLFSKVESIGPFDRRSTNKVAFALGVSAVHVRRLRKRWVGIGLC